MNPEHEWYSRLTEAILKGSHRLEPGDQTRVNQVGAQTTVTYILDEQVGYLLRLAGQRHAAIFHRLAPFDLTPTQFAALAKLAERGACSQNELGRRTAMDVATIKGVVDRLRRKGLVQLQSDPNDKRRSMLSVADEHIDTIPMLFEVGHEISEDTLKPLSDTEKVQFLGLLKKLG